jgi:hypothetical protein
MSTANIEKFLETAYDDQKLAALLAHAQDGKLGYASCCCLRAIPTATHALQEAPGLSSLSARGVDVRHYYASEYLPYAVKAEVEFRDLGRSDAERCERIQPLILAEMERRTWASIASKLPDLPLEEQHRLEVLDAERESLDWDGAHLRAHFGNAGER